MDFNNIEDLGIKMYDEVKRAYYDLDETNRGAMLYLFCGIFGSLNYHPERAKDCDLFFIVPPTLIGAIDVSVFKDYTYRGLPIDVKVTSLSSLDASEAIELMSIMYNEEKTVMISTQTVSTQMPHRIENFYKVLENRLKDKSLVRSEVSKKCSNSFVKAKKKLLVEKDFDPYISLKSLWHSIRLYDFASQYAKSGKVEDFRCCTELLDEIRHDYATNDVADILDLITSKYKPKQNRAASVFKLYFPK